MGSTVGFACNKTDRGKLNDKQNWSFFGDTLRTSRISWRCGSACPRRSSARVLTSTENIIIKILNPLDLSIVERMKHKRSVATKSEYV